jgi:hypothetical protein
VTLFKVIFLADYLQSDDLYNAAIDAVIQTTLEKNLFPVDHSDISLAIDSLPINSSLLKLLQDFCIHESDESWFNEEDVPLSQVKFWYGVAKGMSTILHEEGDRPDEKPWETNVCQYHRHSDGERCEDVSNSTPEVVESDS